MGLFSSRPILGCIRREGTPHKPSHHFKKERSELSLKWLLDESWGRVLTRRDREVVNCTQFLVKIKSKLTNLMKVSRIEGYTGKYGSNPQGIREIFYDLFEFHQIKIWIDGRNWGKYILWKITSRRFHGIKNHRIRLWFHEEIEDRSEMIFPKS